MSFALSFTLLASAEAAEPSKAADAAMDAPGTLRSREPRDSDLHGWLGLYVVKGRSRLSPTELRARREPSEGDPVWTIRARTPVQPKYLFRGIAGLKPGAVTTLVAKPQEIAVDKPIHLGANRDLQWVCQTASYDELGNRHWKDCRLVLTDSGREQILLDREAIEYSSGVFVEWAGDLDDDGRPDLLLFEVNDIYPTTLWLSGPATPGELVHRLLEYESEDFC